MKIASEPSFRVIVSKIMISVLLMLDGATIGVGEAVSIGIGLSRAKPKPNHPTL